MRINKNIKSLMLYNSYRKNIASNSTAMEKISSGKKLNSAKDNPLKIEKSENLKMQIRSLEMANKNLQDSVSMVQVADTAMATISEALIRMKELTVQAGSDNYSESDKQIIQDEINQLNDYINDTALNTEFNGNKLLSSKEVNDNDKPKYIQMQIGANTSEMISIPFFNVSNESLGVDKIDVLTNDGVQEALKNIDSAIVEINGCRSKYASVQSRMESTADIISGGIINFQEASSSIVDADIALEILEVSRTDILMQSATAMLAQSNEFPKDVLNILANLIR